MPQNDQAISTNQDVVDFLTDQHDAIKRLFVETLDAPDAAAQEKSFDALRTMLAVHETAEEMMVHPRVRRKVTGGPRSSRPCWPRNMIPRSLSRRSRSSNSAPPSSALPSFTCRLTSFGTPRRRRPRSSAGWKTSWTPTS